MVDFQFKINSEKLEYSLDKITNRVLNNVPIVPENTIPNINPLTNEFLVLIFFSIIKLIVLKASIANLLQYTEKKLMIIFSKIRICILQFIKKSVINITKKACQHYLIRKNTV